MREVEIGFISFSVFQLYLKILTEAGRFIILWILKRDEGADTDVMFQFCLPNTSCICNTVRAKLALLQQISIFMVFIHFRLCNSVLRKF